MPEDNNDILEFNSELVEIDELKPHPRNYRTHPDDQVEHLEHSIKEHGFYRNVVISSDGVILAGHGVVEAAKKIGMERIPTVRLKIKSDDPQALKVVVGDNDIARLASVNDRALTEMLKEVKDLDLGLIGTGYDERMLASLVMVTRPASEIADHNEAAEWVGMPEYDTSPKTPILIISFRTKEDRQKFADEMGYNVTDSTKSVWWPPREREDLKAVKFEAGESKE